MSRFEINVVDPKLGSDDTEIFEASNEVEAAFRAGFSMGAYFALMIPPMLQDEVGDPIIEAQANNKVINIKQI